MLHDNASRGVLAIAPDPVNAESVPLGNLTTVQLTAERYHPFLQQLLAAAGDTLSLADLPPQDIEAAVYILPKAMENAARRTQGWPDDVQWKNVLQGWGALAVNILSIEAALRLMELGRIKGELAGRPLPAAAVPAPHREKAHPSLPSAFQGPFDWHLARCRVPQAWAMFAADASHRTTLPWNGIRIGHIDTGYTEHAALGWLDGKSVTVRPELGYNFFENVPDPRDPFLPSGNPGHGTSTSAAIAGFDPSAAGGPYYGSAPGAAIIPYRVTDSVIIDHVGRHVAHAIHSAIAKGCDVISISLGGLFNHRQLSDAIDAAYEQGVIVICAAGNIWGEVVYPGRYNRCVTMGGIAPDNKPWGGSARGKYVDLCGPAQQVRRVWPENLPPGRTAFGFHAPPDGSGTSYATALCAGIAALWLAWHGKPVLTSRYPHGWQKAAAFKRLLRTSAWQPGENWDRAEYGAGILDAEALLRLPLPDKNALIKAKAAADVFDPND